MTQTRPELSVKRAVYEHFATVGSRPSLAEVASRVGVELPEVREIFARLRAQRVLVLEADGESIRMAPPFSGVPTQHKVIAGGVAYYANCAWDALGIPAALHQPAIVHSRCEQSLEPLELAVSEQGPAASDWLFHCVVPAAKWWDDIVKPPLGVTVADQRVELGEMDAFGAVTYCVPDGESGQPVLESMLRDAGWEPLPQSKNGDLTVWSYRKGDIRASVRLDAHQQHCGRGFVLKMTAPLQSGSGAR
jgi:hypothetical protein